MKSADITFTHLHTCRLDIQLVHDTAHRLEGYSTMLRDRSTQRKPYDGRETFLCLPDDASVHDESRAVADVLVTQKLKYVFVCGMGGSTLGAQAVYQALTGTYDLATDSIPKLIFIDAASSFLLETIEEIIREYVREPSEIALLCISRSGETLETLASFDYIHGLLADQCGDIRHRIAVITLAHSTLWTRAHEAGYMCIDHRDVGGRFSVFGPVGQLPLLCAGFDVDALLEGALHMRDACLLNNKDNLCRISAACMYLYQRKGLEIHNTFFFNPELRCLGEWWKQLIAESLGKKTDVHGNPVQNGILPIVSIGTTDLHSMAQMYLGGPLGIATTFVVSRDTESKPLKDSSHCAPHLKGMQIQSLAHSLLHGTQQAYAARQLPYLQIEVQDISERALGALMMLKHVEVLYLAHLLSIDPFGQPDVEDIKKAAHTELGI